MGGGNCYYSGSPLQYSFDESSDKGVKVFDLTGDGVLDLRDVPLTKGRKLVRLEADSFETAELLLEKYPTAFVEMKLLLSAPLTSADSARLAAKENLVSLIAEISGGEDVQFESRKGLADSALFDAFYKAEYNAEPSEEVKTLFLCILQELDGK
jgi:exonuclease SbcD